MFLGIQLVFELRERGLAEGLGKGLAVSHVFVDIDAMIKIVREGGMDIGQRQTIFAGNLVDTFPQPLMPYNNIEHCNTMACNTGFPRGNIRARFNVLI